MKSVKLRPERLGKFYEEGGRRVNILSDVSAEFYEGELASIAAVRGIFRPISNIQNNKSQVYLQSSRVIFNQTPQLEQGFRDSYQASG